jgi:hypothetical protein
MVEADPGFMPFRIALDFAAYHSGLPGKLVSVFLTQFNLRSYSKDSPRSRKTNLGSTPELK